MKNFTKIIILLLLCSGFTATWGFYGHRTINRLAVYCLPGDMISLFKKNIDYISEHAVDPDKRRYATKFEAVRHYIDIDHWGENPFDHVPRNYVDAVTKFGDFYIVQGLDTIELAFDNSEESKEFQDRKQFIRNNWMRQRYEEIQVYECDTLMKYFDLKKGQCASFRFTDVFSTYGIIPYELGVQQYRLTEAFQARDIDRIMRIATDMGHYIADAHVPLHTTENYNGQMTGQDGIHAFWESRLPELFAEEEYDFIVGQADYIEDKTAYFWKIIEDSHSHLQKVLDVEMKLREDYEQDRQYCYEERLGTTVRLECEGYAREYHELLGGMVEERMRGSIKSVADCWYTAWVDAGQPIFENVGVLELIDEKIEKAFGLGRILGRQH
ncbi:zinc dependent phospholipase C family protein [Portibacter lacus]|uniref:S1/P1 Nuclease n=1 Tax=Portibacter lacus TaxID=1099794 RepID=A0AA37STQ8_9BACT|nr:zinc dependent phospholipase C family protein [Portibacter lacus]GLR20057.1 hypothetical protein GCM10007940_46730 [Portibacter lacus]